MFLSIHDFIWLSKPHSCLECTQSADLQAVFKAQNNRLRLKGLFFVPISLIEFERIFTRASSYHGTINHLGCEEEYCREYYSLKTLSSVCPTNNYFYSRGQGAQYRLKLSFVLQKSALIKSWVAFLKFLPFNHMYERSLFSNIQSICICGEDLPQRESMGKNLPSKIHEFKDFF